MTDSFLAFQLRGEFNGQLPQETLRALTELSDEFETYDALPSVLFARTTIDRAPAIVALPGIASFRDSTELARQLVWSVNNQVMIAEVHERTMGHNGIAKVVPEEELVDGHPKYPTLKMTGGAPRWAEDPTIDLNTRYCYVGALNVSLEFQRRSSYDPSDPVNLAFSDAARRFPVALAAGNVNGDPDPTMFAWPLNPDVIAVGASSPDGSELLECSRVGNADQGISGPDVVANGIDESGEPGTSYAAPVVSSQLAQIAAALMSVRSACLYNTEFPEGVPLSGRCFVDFERATTGHAKRVTDFAPRRRQLPALPTGVVSSHAAELFASQPQLMPLRGRPGSLVLRRALIASARPIPNSEFSRVGAGFVSDDTTLEYLTRLTVDRLSALYGVVFEGQNIRVFDADLIAAFLEGARDSMIGWANGITDFTQSGGVSFIEPGHVKSNSPSLVP